VLPVDEIGGAIARALARAQQPAKRRRV